MTRALSVADTTPAHHSPHPDPTAPNAAVLPLGMACSALAAGLGFALHDRSGRSEIQVVDHHWLTWMGGPHGGVYAALADVLNWFGGPLGAVLPVALLLLLIGRRRWWSVAYLVTAYLLGNVVVVQVLKHLVDRPRPAHPLVRVDHGSFPSGHSADAALLVVVVGAVLVPAARRRSWWLFGGAFILAMMWSRTWLHAHWLSDTVAGASIGAGAALLLWRAFAPLLARERISRGLPGDQDGVRRRHFGDVRSLEQRVDGVRDLSG
ncbi:phosphatase PAP2 family protein [Streptomyces sp. NBC_00775]|uniref:phosphatase PAP2 family protein n=1 Tax=Streptomyces sp. NBC_00775 TaxID=2975828 RepID=UPI002ED40421|nr:phosphatase PAP2 family protein [Streptomyces sp. NBC_00775]